MSERVDTSKYTDQQYIDHDPFAGDSDVDIRGRRVKIVTTRKPQHCTDVYCKGKKKPAGTRMRRETAVVDGEWCASYACLECIARWFDEEPSAVPARRGGGR